MSTATKPTIGEIYVITPELAGKYLGRRFRIVEHKQVNAVGQDLETGQRLRAKFALWVPAPVDGVADATAITAPALPEVHQGQFVVKAATPAAAAWKVGDDEIFVILHVLTSGKLKLVRAGGHPQRRYWASVPRAYVVPVELDLAIKQTEEVST